MKVALSATYVLPFRADRRLEGKGVMTATVERDAVGSRVRELREARNMTQDDLVGLLGLTRPAVSRIESGERGLAAAELAALAAHFGVSADYLLFGERDEEFLLRAEDDADCAQALAFARGVAQDVEFVQALFG
jgi:transcriptional regulator with XRE-family HTH domain